MNEVSKTSVDKVKASGATAATPSTTGSEAVKTATKLELGKTTKNPRVIRNFTYELHDVNDAEDIFTSKISFFLKELNKQLNALVNSTIYTENKENLDKALKSKSEFRKELLRLLKTECTDFYQKYYCEAKIFGNKAKYFRTVIEEYRRILLSRLHRQTIIDMIVKDPTITYQEVFNKLCELNERSSDKDYKFNWISKAEFNNIIKQVSNLDKSTSSEVSEAKAASYATAAKQAGEATIDNLPSEAKTIDTYSIDYTGEDNQISEFNLTDNDEYYLIEFKLKYSDYTIQSDSLLTYQCQVPKKQIKGLTTGYTKLKKFTRPRIFLNDNKLYISFNYELSLCSERAIACATAPDGTWQFKTMGIDIGVAKSATAAIMTTNMCWQYSSTADTKDTEYPADKQSGDGGETSEKPAKQAEPELIAAIDFTQPVAISNELTISDKTQSVSKHIEILKNEQNHIYKKEQAIYDLLKLKQFDGNSINCVDELVNHAKQQLINDVASPSPTPCLHHLATPLDLLHKYQRLNKLRLHLRHKVSNLKKELSFLRSDCKRHDITCD